MFERDDVLRLIERVSVFCGSIFVQRFMRIYLSFENLKSSVFRDIYNIFAARKLKRSRDFRKEEREKKTDPRGNISHRNESWARSIVFRGNKVWCH